jgi:CheY-like chemotaxis protein
VDDERELVDLGRELLTPLGYEVVGFNSPNEALATFADRPGRFDLLMTDMTMPGMTGLELAKECLRIRPGLPVILCTGFSEMVTPRHYGPWDPGS